MITTLRAMLPVATHRFFAVPAFNVYNLETVEAVIAAAEVTDSPVIMGISMSAMQYGGPGLFAAAVAAAKQTAVPVVIHLDHFTDLKLIHQGLLWGASSVMFDGSHLTFIKNVAETRAAVRLARRWKASVEGEVGTIGGQEDGVLRAPIDLADPAEAEHFAKHTGIDALAAGLGTSHGLPVPKETIHIELLDAIKARVKVPLVLHGASNLSPALLRAGIRHGISKINVDTELRQAFTTAVRKSLTRDEKLINPREYLGAGRQAVQADAERLLKLFGAVKQADAVRHRR